MVGGRSWSRDLRRSGIRSRVVLLRSCGVGRTVGRTASRTWTLSTRGGSGLWRLTITIYRWTLLVAAKVLWWARSRVESGRALGTSQLRRHAMALGRLLWGRCQSRATLGSTACHYAAEQVTRSMANLRWLRLRGAVVLRALTGAAASFKFALELGDALLVFCFHLVV
jgi:hypothetical protein